MSANVNVQCLPPFSFAIIHTSKDCRVDYLQSCSKQLLRDYSALEPVTSQSWRLPFGWPGQRSRRRGGLLTRPLRVTNPAGDIWQLAGGLGPGGASCDLSGRATTISGVCWRTGLTGFGLWAFGAIPVVLALGSELWPGGVTAVDRVSAPIVDSRRCRLLRLYFLPLCSITYDLGDWCRLTTVACCHFLKPGNGAILTGSPSRSTGRSSLTCVLW